MAPVEQNEPWLSSAIDIVSQTVEKVQKEGIKPENIYFFGFSQGLVLR
jgi:phospholipase/carboxylesterase